MIRAQLDRRFLKPTGASLVAMALLTLLVGQATAATASPTMKLTQVSNRNIVAALSHFPDGVEVQLRASISGGSGMATAMTTKSGTMSAGFQVPEDFLGTVTISAAVEDIDVSKTINIVGRDNGSTVTTSKSTTSTTARPSTTTTVAAKSTGKWISGAAGVNYEGFADFRSKELGAISTWTDSAGACPDQAGLVAPVTYASKHNSYVIDAIGGNFDGDWSKAANGGLNATWTACLNAIKAKWGTNDPSKLYISLFHEANGFWYEWSVKNASDIPKFKSAFAQFAKLQQQIIPGSKLIFSFNAENLAPFPIEDLVPSESIDAVGVDYYSMHYPRVKFTDYTDLAKSVGKPLIVQEWGFKNKDNPAGFVQYMHDNFSKYGGTGPGQVMLENYFDLLEYKISDGSNTASETQKYKDLF